MWIIWNQQYILKIKVRNILRYTRRMGDIEMFLQNYFDSHQAYEYFINKMHGKGHNYLSSKQQTDDLSSVKDVDSEIDMILENIFICSM